MGSRCEGTAVDTDGNNNTLEVSSEQNGQENFDEPPLNAPASDQGKTGKTTELKHTLQIGVEMQNHGNCHKQPPSKKFVQLDPSAREFKPVYSLQTPLIVPPPAPFALYSLQTPLIQTPLIVPPPAPCVLYSLQTPLIVPPPAPFAAWNFVQPTVGHPSQLAYVAASQFITAYMPEQFNLNYMPSSVPSPPLAWDPSITVVLLNTVPLETHPIQQSDTDYSISASSAVPSASAQLNAIGLSHMGIGYGRGGRSQRISTGESEPTRRPVATVGAAWTAPKRENGSQVLPQFAFDEAEAVSNCTQARTTLMMKNIPNKFKQVSVLIDFCILILLNINLDY